MADAVFIGLRNNHTVRSAYIDRAAQKFDLYVAETRFRPTATLDASATKQWEKSAHGSAITFSPSASWLTPTGAQFGFSWARSLTDQASGYNRSDVATLSVTQPLLSGAGIAVNMAPVRIARLQERINRLTLKSSVSDTITQIVFAYRTLLLAQHGDQIAEQSVSQTEQMLKTNHFLIDAGRMAASEIVQTEANLANQQVSLLQAEQAKNSAQLNLLRLLAMDLHTNIVASDNLTPQHLAVNVEQAVELAQSNRMDYLSEQLSLEQARQELIVAKSNRLWKLALVGNVQYAQNKGPNYGAASSGNSNVGTTQGSSAGVGVTLSIPIGDVTLEQQEVHASTAVRSSEERVRDASQQVEAQVRDAVQGVELAWRQLMAARHAQSLAEKAVELERKKLQTGRASNFEVLSYENNLTAAKVQCVQATMTYLNALTTLDSQIGTTLDTWRINLNG